MGYKLQFVFYYAILIMTVVSPCIWAETTTEYQGELTAWGMVEENTTRQNGLRYLPTLTIYGSFQEGVEWDTEISANVFYIYQEDKEENDSTESDITAHRLWWRVFTENFEARIGLQKLNFGPGKVLRALQWFDQIDPKDPTGFTEGVKGILIRNYFQNDANLWGWILYDNQDPMGISPYSTFENQLEWGGRYEVLINDSEVGLSVHHRIIDSSQLFGEKIETLAQEKKNENRIGFDINLDIEVGAWLEASFIEIEEDPNLPRQQKYIVLGVDYSINIGNGLYLAIEGLASETNYHSKDPETESLETIAFTQSYPLNLLDTIKLIETWSSKQETTSIHTAWQRVYDEITFNTIFTYVNSGDMSSEIPERSIQLLVQYNH